VTDQMPRVLLVDDEPNVLDALRRHLRRGFTVETATSGPQALECIAASGPFAVIVSDYQMPGMNGAAFLREAKRVAPETTRMLLTGQADLAGAAAVVNEGGVFRFLLKPVTTEGLVTALHAGVEQHELVQAERVLLEQTLAGSVRAMTEVLSLLPPAAFARATRLRALGSVLFDAAQIDAPWHVSVALMLSQIGAITLPPTVLERVAAGAALADEEAAMVARMPALAVQILAEIPRLDDVRNAIAQQDRVEDAPLGARVLRIVRDYDALESAGRSVGDALGEMERRGTYDAELLRALAAGLSNQAERPTELVSLARLGVDMMLAEDVFTAGGVKLVPRGHVITPSLLERIRNFARVPPGISEPLCVFASGAALDGAA